MKRGLLALLITVCFLLSLLPTAWAAPQTPLADAKTAYVVVPGFLGSELKNENGVSVWLSLANPLSLPAVLPQLAIETKLTPYGEYGTLNTYETLVKTLRDLYGADSVRFFPYDWRQSIAASAKNLRDYIDKDLAGFDSVVLIGHSMGGLVSCSLVSQFGAGKVGRIITVGTPHKGAYSAVKALTVSATSVLSGAPGLTEQMKTLLEPIFAPVASKLPSIYEMMPAGLPSSVEAKLNASMMTAGKPFLPSLSGVDKLTSVTAIYGTGHDTLAAPDSDGKFGTGDGDATVLTASARGDFANALELAGAEHNELVTTPSGIAVIVGLLPDYEGPTSWARQEVKTAIAYRLVPEELLGDFTAPATRREFALLAVTLYETYTKSTIKPTVTFPDSTDEVMRKAGTIGVVNALNGRAEPTLPITREQAATMMARLLKALKLDIKDAAAPGYADRSAISDWAAQSVAEMQTAQVMQGTGNNKFSPKGSITREQSIMATIRLCHYVLKSALPQ